MTLFVSILRTLLIAVTVLTVVSRADRGNNTESPLLFKNVHDRINVQNIFFNSDVKTYSDLLMSASILGGKDVDDRINENGNEFESLLVFEKFLADEKFKLFSSSPEENSNIVVQGLQQEDLQDDRCAADLMTIVASINETWALSMIDAMGKPTAGLLRSTPVLPPKFLGDFDQCLDIATLQDFDTQYCSTLMAIEINVSGKLTQPIVFYEGLCLPSSCSSNDIEGILNRTLISRPDLFVGAALMTNCQERHLPLTTKATVIICVLALFATLMVIATAYDVFYLRWMARSRSYSHTIGLYDHKAMDGGATEGQGKHRSEYEPLIAPQVQNKMNHEPGMAGQLLLSFSVYTNTCKLFSTHQSPGSIECIHGIRFISMTWVILGHTFVMGLQAMDNVAPYLKVSYDRWTFQAVQNALVSVDTFFALSGLLMTYLVLKELSKKGISGKFFGLYYFHRFWRLTPPYMLVMMTYIPLYKYVSDGPIWPQKGIEIDECEDTWWTNLLYVNNFFKMDKMCMGWSWYLANDMQFYVISPLLFLPLFYFGSVGLIAPLLGLLVNAICSGVISHEYGLEPNMDILHQKNAQDYQKMYYMKPYTRIGPYLIGIITGYLLYRCECRARLSKWAVALGWMLATAVAVSVLYGLYEHSGGKNELNSEVGALYNALHRIGWGMAVCWVIYACANGYGGFVNTLLSWKALIPLSKLTYCAYLVHILVLEFFFFSQRRPFYLDNTNVAYTFVGTLTLAYAAAYVASMAYEAPMMGLEKVLRGQGQKKE